MKALPPRSFRALLAPAIVGIVAASMLPPATKALAFTPAISSASADGALVNPPEARPQGWLGIQLGDPGASAPGGASGPGVVITGVVAGSPAQEAGLRARDRILAINGKSVSRPPEVISTIGALGPESWVDLSIRRKTREMDVRVLLEDRPQNGSALRMLDGWIGLEAIDLPPSLREHFGAPREAGVMISDVSSEGPAYAAGLLVGDVVFEVEGESIRSPRALQQAVTRGGVGNRLEMRLMRGGAEIVIEPLVETRAAEK